MERRLIKIGEAAQMLGTSPSTLRMWETTGELLPTRRTRGGTRYYPIADLLAQTEVVESARQLSMI